MGLFDKANIGSTLGAAGSIGGSIISGVSSMIAAKSNRDWQERQAAIERQWQGMPAQVMRARQAGLNPNLVFGKGTGITNVPSTPSAPNMPQVPDFGASLAELGKSYDDREMNRAAKEAEAIERTSNARNLDEDTHRQAIENLTLKQRLYFTLQEAEARAKEKGEDAKAAEIRKEMEEIKKEILEGQKPALIDQPKKENALTEQKTKTSEAEAGMYKEQGAAARRNAAANERQAKAAETQAETQRRIGEQTIKVLQNEQNDRYWSWKHKKLAYIIKEAGSDAEIQLGRIMSEIHNNGYYQWATKAKAYVAATPLLGNIIEALGGVGETYATLKAVEAVSNSQGSHQQTVTDYDKHGNMVHQRVTSGSSSSSKNYNGTARAKAKRMRKFKK